MISSIVFTCSLLGTCVGNQPAPRERNVPLPLYDQDAFAREHLKLVRYRIKSVEEDILWWEKQLQTDPIPKPELAKKIRKVIDVLRAELVEDREHERQVAADLGIIYRSLAPMPHEKK